MKRSTREKRDQRRRETLRKTRERLGTIGRAVGRRVRAEVDRPDFGLRLIIILKLVKGTLLLVGGLAALALIHHDLGADALRLAEWLHFDPNGKYMHIVLERLEVVTPHQLKMIGGGAMVYSAILLLEAWGLHKRRTWAEWFTIGVTCLFIPVEIYELIEKPSWRMVGVLSLNVAVAVYLARHHILFHAGPLWTRARKLWEGRASTSST